MLMVVSFVINYMLMVKGTDYLQVWDCNYDECDKKCNKWGKYLSSIDASSQSQVYDASLETTVSYPSNH